MYDRTFGTDWEGTELTHEAAIDRAFALGVAAGCGRERPEELERILATFPGAYERSMVELAYDEGRTRALETPVEEPEAVWTELVDAAGTPRSPPLPSALPGALSELTLVRSPRTGPPSSLDLPRFLRK
ncbi:hypothetical protein DQW50_11360 [Halorubrum sp. 48-1-W]|uniref:hypothetical protein n=1 Tax=Halorubrum sp. 48-1-W TaxID=2249761 RepID=UPI000DCBDA08|nr:hypothetical protein [Halorubrum sp. 48-1-W]RAW45064.1 hypothetical protein DQW50_11360 [Halorubrum sp. 48-1-W]